MSTHSDRAAKASSDAFVEQFIGSSAGRSREFETREGSVHTDSQDFRTWTPPAALNAEELLARMPPVAPEPEAPPLAAPAVAPVEIPEPQIEIAPPPAAIVVSEPCPICPSQTQTIAELQQDLAGVRADNQALARLVAQMSTLEPGAVKGLREELQRAAMLIAESIMGRAVEVDSTWLSQQITQCLSQLEHALGGVRVMVNPADFAALESSWGEFHSEARLVADPRQQRGGFLIESPEFALDAGLGRRLQWAATEEKSL
jgi:hypothetical protein